ncbi:iron ABC transporter permease [candidate division WOR-3 bacterium]|uniref:Iron ABC transporter permease n=1 Tax=candidate division WOR-3 bacterium TaxID=2052148 RepID=A0A660SFC5_UNCW3|nr:MAG: iron ABC transporter permease [candidate division WOR-3 bacterium]
MRAKVIVPLLGILSLIYIFLLPNPPSPVILKIRIFRLLLAIYTGVTLSVFGLFLQGALNNPLVEPYTLGIASGAALGVSIGILVGSALSINILAFLGAVTAATLVFFLARLSGRLLREGLILAGIIISFFASGVVFLLLVLNGRELHEIIYLLMGYLGRVPTRSSYLHLSLSSLIAGVSLFYIFFTTKALDIIATGYESAHSLGINVNRLLTRGFIIISLNVGLLVTQVGVIGFVGLIVPHLARLLVGDHHRPAFYASMFIGIGFILIADLLSRSLTTIELPVGVITSIFGAPFFIYLMIRR